MTTITSGNFFSMNYDVDYSMAHILSYLVADLNDQFQPPAHAGSSLADFSSLKMEAIHSSKTLVHTRSTRRHIPEDGIL
jgi:hypothetical protein